MDETLVHQFDELWVRLDALKERPEPVVLPDHVERVIQAALAFVEGLVGADKMVEEDWYESRRLLEGNLARSVAEYYRTEANG